MFCHSVEFYCIKNQLIDRKWKSNEQTKKKTLIKSINFKNVIVDKFNWSQKYTNNSS